MKLKPSWVSIIFFFISIAITFIFCFRTWDDGYNFWKSGRVEFDVTGQIGDFVGGVIGTIISAAGFYFLYSNHWKTIFKRVMTL